MTNLNRRMFVRALGAAGTVLSTGTGRTAMAAAAAPPNILFIMADDLGYADLSCTGSHHILTPAIDSIAADGLQLRQGYSNSSICSPTRTALLTGCYQQRFTIGLEEPLAGTPRPDQGVPLDRPTIASAFKSRGYRTKLIGKWHLGMPPSHGPLAHGYDEFLGIVEGAADYFRHRMVQASREVGIGLAENDSPATRNGYLTDIFGDEAVSTIQSADPRPFFISLHFTAPHWPWEGREDAVIAQGIAQSQHQDGGNLAKYKVMVEAMDENVGKVLAALVRTGKADNTIVVFTSDNGGERFSETWPFTGVKGELLEGGIRVPIMMRWTGRIQARARSEQVMVSMDFLPTLLAMSGGASKAGQFDGLDLSAQLRDRAAPVTRTLYWRFKANAQAAMRDGDWKYLKLGGKEHLFNLSSDERERADLGASDSMRMAAMRARWETWNATMLPYPADSFSDQIKNSYPDRY